MNENQQEKLVLVDGEIMPEAEAFIDVNDRGHNFGDGVFGKISIDFDGCNNEGGDGCTHEQVG